ncbi:MFS transporter [uncultured Amnibacterium sp.]|uniref:MFS transporter n=1 Tax=uncultured Amnibacterium sp. TaxID=1631851 RepID=UPI0035CC8200
MTTTSAPNVVRWRNGVGVAFGLGGLNLATWGPRLPTIKHDLRLDDGALGLLVAGMTVASIVGLLSSSAMLSRLGARRAIALMMSLVAVGVAIIGLGSGIGHSPAVVEVGFLCVGFGLGTSDVMINVEASALERASGRVLMPLLHACWSAGAVVGSGIGAAAAALAIAPAWQFLVESVLTIVAILIAVRGLPDAEPAPSGAAAPVRERIRTWLSGWADLRLLMIGVVMLGVELGEGSANNWLTLGVAQGHRQTDAIAALFFTVFAASETTARVLGGPLVARLGRVNAVRVTTVLGALGLIAFILGGPPWLVLLGTVLWAIGVSMGFPLGMSAAAESGPNPAARVSVVASLGYLANLGGPPVVGFLSQGVGLLNAFWLLVAFMVVALLAAPALAGRVRTERTAAQEARR